ncbi:MAG: MFS transporter, partial [Solirubrobacteraceae bacterium]
IVADRLGARRVTLTAAALLCVSCVAQALPSLPALLAGRTVFGVAFGVVWTTGMAWLAELDAEAGRGSGLGAAVTYSSVGVMVGPAVAGALAQHAGLGAPFLAIALASALLALPLVACGRGPVAPAAAVRDRMRGGNARAPGGDDELDDRRCALGDEELSLDGYERVQADDAGAAGRTVRELLVLMRRPGVGAAAGALIISGAVSSASQLLVSAGLHHAGLSTSRIGLAFSLAAVCYIVVSGIVVRLRGRAQTLRFNALSAMIAALGLAPALTGGGVVALVAALLLTCAPRAAISTVAYGLAAAERDAETTTDGLVFGMLNGGWAAATVLMPVIAGAVQQVAGAQAAYLAVIIPCCGIAAWLMTAAAGRGRGGRRRHRHRRLALGLHRI